MPSIHSGKSLPDQTSSLIRHFLGYLLVGGTAFVADAATLTFLTEIVSLHYLLSATAGFLIGLGVNYLLCIAWVFKHRALEDRRHELVLFTLIGIAGLILNNLLLFALTDGAGLHYLISKVITAALVLVFNFLLRRQLLFTDNRHSSWLRQRLTKPQAD